MQFINVSFYLALSLSHNVSVPVFPIQTSLIASSAHFSTDHPGKRQQNIFLQPFCYFVLCTETWTGLYIRAGSRRSSPASLPGFAGYFYCFTSLNMLRRWTHSRLLFTKLCLLKNLKKTLPEKLTIIHDVADNLLLTYSWTNGMKRLDSSLSITRGTTTDLLTQRASGELACYSS